MKKQMAYPNGSGRSKAGRGAAGNTKSLEGSIRIKICGLRRAEDIACANTLMPEYVGFVFAKKSRRYIPPEQAGTLRAKLAAGITPVGVFVNEAPETVAQLLESGIIDIAQLHGQEDEAYLERLRACTNRPLIQAFRIACAADIARARRSSAWRVLVDHGAGGTGEAFDWSLLKELDRPYFLAGGLTPGNAAEAAARLHPFAVDVSSGVETEGWKDPAKMEAFVRAIRSD